VRGIIGPKETTGPRSLDRSDTALWPAHSGSEGLAQFQCEVRRLESLLSRYDADDGCC
jgi:hypothetical protein